MKNHNITRLLALLLALLLPVSLLPAFASAEEAPGLTITDGVCEISTPQELLALAEYCRLDSNSQGLTVRLTADLSLSGAEMLPIPSFSGTFDGQGHTISDLSLTGSYSPCGLFARVEQSGVVQDLVLTGAVTPAGSGSYIGGIAGINRGLIAGCSFTGSVIGTEAVGGIVGSNRASGCVEACTVTGSVTGKNMTGGLVGENAGSVAGCSNRSYVNIDSVEPVLNLNEIDTTDLLQTFTASSAEALGVTRDTGGIAGYSSGFITLCSNTATVGYSHEGYNIGGIVGRSCGFLLTCTNSGEVYGRKDVGGIAGQAEPYVDLLTSGSMVDTLTGQFNGLTYLMNRTVRDARSMGIAAAQDLADAAADLAQARAAISGIDPTDPESLQAAFHSISGAFSSISGSLPGIIDGIQASGDTLENDMDSINGQISAIGSTTAGIINSLGGEETLLTVVDLSADDVAGATFGRISACRNSGSVSGDLNVGGIAGQMSIESDNDPEDELGVTLKGLKKSEFRYRVVVDLCSNYGSVTARKSCAGGICGRETLGNISGVQNYGPVSGENGGYVGGIAGLTDSVVSDSYSKCRLSGNTYVGGIVGCGSGEEEADEESSGSSVSGCISLISLADSGQYVGAISGYDLGTFTENYFVSDTLQGINGVNTAGRAQAISYEELLEQEGLPADFKSFTLTFTADGETLMELPFHYGDSFDSTIYPTIPQKEGYSACWETVDLTLLHNDTEVTAVYNRYSTLLPSNITREDGRPALYVDGAFSSDSRLVAEVVSSTEDYSELQQPWYDQLTSQLQDLFQGREVDATVCRKLVEVLDLTIPEDGSSTHTLRYTLPAGTRACRIYTDYGNGNVEQETESIGSYYTFPVTGTRVRLVVFSTVRTLWLLLAGLAVLVLLVSLFALLGHISRRRRLRRQQRRQALQADPASARAAAKKRRRGWLIALSVLVVLAGLAVGLSYSPIGKELRAVARVRSIFSGSTDAYDVSIDAKLDRTPVTVSGHTEVWEADGTEIASFTTDNGFTVWFANDLVCTRNGTLYGIDASLPNYAQMLKVVEALYLQGSVKITEVTPGSEYTLTISEKGAQEVVTSLLPTLENSGFGCDSLTLQLTAKDGSPEAILLSGSGSLESGKLWTLDAAFLAAERSHEVPQAVKTALLSGEEPVCVLTSELLSFAEAWMEFDSAPAVTGTLQLKANCGTLVLDNTLDYARQLVRDTPVSCVKKNSLAVYFTDSAICTADGTALTGAAVSLGDSARLLSLAERLCCTDAISLKTAGGDTTVTVELNKADLAELCGMIAPDTAALNLSYTSGTLTARVTDGKIRAVSIACSGSLRVVVTDVPVSLSADIALTYPSKLSAFPAAATDALVPQIAAGN